MRKVEGCISPDGIFWPCERCQKDRCKVALGVEGFRKALALVEHYPEDLDLHCSSPSMSPLTISPLDSEVGEGSIGMVRGGGE